MIVLFYILYILPICVVAFIGALICGKMKVREYLSNHKIIKIAGAIYGLIFSIYSLFVPILAIKELWNKYFICIIPCGIAFILLGNVIDEQ